MIKLQLLLRHPSAEPGIDPALGELLAQHGMTVTGVGRASLSAQMTQAAFDQQFGPMPHLAAGFAPLSAPELPVPSGLADAISQITIAPHHRATNHS